MHLADARLSASVSAGHVSMLQDSMMQLFTMMFGDVQFSTFKTIMNINTVSLTVDADVDPQLLTKPLFAALTI